VSMRKNLSFGVMSGVMPAMSSDVAEASDPVWDESVAPDGGRVTPEGPVTAVEPDEPDVRTFAPTATAPTPSAVTPVHRRNDRRVPTTRRFDW